MLKSLFKGSNVTNKTIWNIAYSIILGNLAQTIIALTDTAFLGRLGEVELGASAMSGIYYYFFTTLAWGFAIGVQIIIARRFGEGNLSKIGNVLCHGFLFVFVFAAFLFSVIHYLSPIFLDSVISSKNVYNVSLDFLDYRGYGIFFSSLNFMYRSFYIGISKTKSIAYSTLIMAVVNIVLDYLLIFGSSFTPALGVKGAAIASVCAEISATIFFTIYTLSTNPIKGNKLFRHFKFEFSILKNVLTLSIPTMLQKFFSIGAWLAFFFMIENMGERPLAVTMVIRSVFMLISIPAFALGSASNTLTSRLIGEGRANEVLPTVWRIVRMSFIIITPIALLVALFPSQTLSIYTDNAAIIQDAIPILYLATVVVYTFAVGMAFFEAVAGTGYTAYALYIEAIALVVYVALIWLFTKVLNLELFWVWTTEFMYGIFLSIFTILFMRYYKWQKKKI